MNWNLSKYLPAKGNVQDYFHSVLGGYISAVYQFICEQEPGGHRTPRRRNQTSLSQTQSVTHGVGTDEASSKFAKELINGDLSQKLFM